MIKDTIVSIMHLYAFLVRYEKHISYDLALNYAIVLLNRDFGIADHQEYLNIFIKDYHSEENLDKLEIKDNYMQLCYEITKSLDIKQRIIVLIHLLRFAKVFKISSMIGSDDNKDLLGLIQETGRFFKIQEGIITDLSAFVFNYLNKISKKDNLLVLNGISAHDYVCHKGISCLKGEIFFFYLENLNVYLFFQDGNDQVYLNDILIVPGKFYFFTKSSRLSIEGATDIFFNELFKISIKRKTKQNIKLFIKNLSFNYKEGENGLKNLNLVGESGELIGILGKSGAGKTTLFRLLTTQLKPTQGDILINNISYKNNFAYIKNIIGYMPQSDALIGELTVFENLFIYTRLWMNNLNKSQATERVEYILSEFELERIRNRKVGNLKEKLISGGERKRVNLAMEILRDPGILFADEPLSGLSSSDAKGIMQILHEQALKGRIVFINIHQPSNDIYNMFDNMLILDTGGQPVIYANPMTIIKRIDDYKKRNGYYMTLKKDCNYSEYIFDTLDEKTTNEIGEHTNNRKVAPDKWFALLNDAPNDIASDRGTVVDNVDEIRQVNISRLKQLAYFLERGYLMKFANKQYIGLIVSVPLVLSIILSIVIHSSTKYEKGYTFMDNPNMVSFLFMSIVVILFTGLLTSAEEIDHDKPIIKREYLLRLSSLSYLLSKLLQVFLISGVQVILFIAIALSILEIKGMLLKYLLVFWTLSFSANLAGLLLSTILNTAVTIYIFIPFVLIPQILFSGVVIRYDDMNPSIVNPKFTPFVSTLLPSRWAFEAIAVEQFKNNKYEKGFFKLEKDISNLSYLDYYLIPDLLNQLMKKDDFNPELINNGIRYINNHYPFSGIIQQIEPEGGIGNVIRQLNSLRAAISKDLLLLQDQKSKLISKQTTLKRNKYYNIALADVLLNTKEVESFIVQDNEFIRVFEPVYDYPDSKIGRAHLYAPVKRIGNYYFDTFAYNLIVLWSINLVLAIMLTVIFTYKYKIEL